MEKDRGHRARACRIGRGRGWNLCQPCGMVRRHGARSQKLERTALADIEAARRVIEGVVLRTPMLPAPKLSALTGAEVYVKYENLQVTNSFKDRGALVKLASLSEAERNAASSPCRPATMPRRWPIMPQRLGIPATIVMPVTTPFVKIAATRSHGAEVVLHGEISGRSAGALRTNSGAARPPARSSLRRSSHHRRAGHDRTRNAGRRARPRHAGVSRSAVAA